MRGMCAVLFGGVLAVVVCSTAWADEPAPQRTSILDGSVAVQASAYIAYPVMVDASVMTLPHIAGHVVATGGSGNDIEVVVFTETQFINWKNDHKKGSLFTSGQVTACDLNVALEGSGKYYVMLSNVFSAFTPKTVEGKIDLVWTPPPPPAPTKDEQNAQNSLLLTGIAIIVGVLVLVGAIGGLIVWLVMSRKKKGPVGGGQA